MRGNKIAKQLGLEAYRSDYILSCYKNYDLSKLFPKVEIPKFVADEINEFLPDSKDLCIGSWNDESFTNTTNDWIDNHFEIFLKAVLYGYKIEKEERFILPMECSGWEDGSDVTKLYAHKIGKRWVASEYYDEQTTMVPTVTQSQIDTAPEWVKTVAKNKIKVNWNDDRQSIKEPVPRWPTKEPRPIDNRLKESDKNMKVKTRYTGIVPKGSKGTVIEETESEKKVKFENGEQLWFMNRDLEVEEDQ